MTSAHKPTVLAQAILMLCLTATTPVVDGQTVQPPQLDRQSLIATARETMKTVRYCALITVDSAGRARARTMDPFLPDENMIVWLATNPKSRKVAEIRRNSHVTLYYFDSDSQAYVTISGIARIVNDRKEKAARWKDEWKAFYPDRDKNYLLIAVSPERLEVVNVKKGIVGDPRTWTPPAVVFSKRKSKP